MGLIKRLWNWLPTARRPRIGLVVLLFADTIGLLVSAVTATAIHFDGQCWPTVCASYIHRHMRSIPFAVVAYLVSLSLFRLYRSAWRFAGVEALWNVIYACCLGIGGLATTQLVIDGATFPPSVLIIMWGTSVAITGGIRVSLRALGMARQRVKLASNGDTVRRRAKRAIILGGGTNGARILRAIREDPSLGYEVIGFLDDDPLKHDIYVGTARVLGPISALPRYIEEQAVDEVVVALPEASGETLRECVMQCRKHRLPVKTVPYIRDMLDGHALVRMEDISVEDLLGRSPAKTDIAEAGAYLRGKRVLVTGAGGSIGSELCRQIARQEPASLTLFGHGEHSIQCIYQELLAVHPSTAGRVHCVIGSVSRENRVRQTFGAYRPQVVFHAAAHKHVPIMETNEQDAVENNVLGTRCVADACGMFAAERMVLISTDKAANPCSVMGATKWLCEEILRAMTSVWPDTSFIAVRFGNVLGSRGSVVPVFKEQIRRGGPVTVTHPDMTRYFMTIPEAICLVLRAGAVGKTGELYLLDMGNQIRILDLAKDMIRLCGLKPGVDMPIRFTGLRPGERLHEQLVSSQERIASTRWDGLSTVHRPAYFAQPELSRALERLEELAAHGTAAETRRALGELVPAYDAFPETPQENYPASVDR